MCLDKVSVFLRLGGCWSWGVASTRNIRVAREPGKLVPLVRAGHGALGTLVPLTMI